MFVSNNIKEHRSYSRREQIWYQKYFQKILRRQRLFQQRRHEKFQWQFTCSNVMSDHVWIMLIWRVHYYYYRSCFGSHLAIKINTWFIHSVYPSLYLYFKLISLFIFPVVFCYLNQDENFHSPRRIRQKNITLDMQAKHWTLEEIDYVSYLDHWTVWHRT